MDPSGSGSTPQSGRQAAVPIRRDDVLAAYADGIDAIERAATQVEDWSATTPCDQWKAVDLAGHLLAIVRYYHGLLDAVARGTPRRRLPVGNRLQTMNHRDLAALPPEGGPERIGSFVASARRYGERIAAADWDRPLGEWDTVGPLTLGEHTGLAIVEWHVHGWDMARAAGGDYRPADPATIEAAGRILFGPPPDEDPWSAILIRAGRLPP